MATNRAIDRIRKDKRRRAREVQAFADRDQTIETRWDDLYEYVDEALAELPAKLREPLVGHYLEGQTHAHIAEALGISRQAVTRRIAKGVSAMRNTLKRRGIPVAGPALAAMLGANLADAAAIPASLTSTLGKLTVAGIQHSAAPTTAGTTAATAGGLLAIKKLGIGVAILAVAVLATWVLTGNDDDGAQPNEMTAQDDAVPDLQLQSLASAESEPVPASDDTAPVGEEIDLASEGGTVTGRVYDAVSGKGIEGVRVLASFERSSRWSAVTDSRGVYRIEDLHAGEFAIHPSGYRVVEYPIPRRIISQVITIPENGIVENVNFTFTKGIRVAGKVVSHSKQPVEGARVGAMLRSVSMARSVTSDEEGAFAIYMPDPGPDLVLQAGTDGYESRVLGPLKLTRTGIEGLTLELTEPRTAKVSGKVVNANGQPIEGANVHVNRGATGYLIGMESGTSATDGTFTIAKLAPGEYSVRPTPPGVRTYNREDEVMRVTLSAGQTLSGLHIVLGGDKGSLAIAGRVVDTSGNPIEGVEVTAGSETVRSGEDGRFTITGLLDGPYYVNAHYMDQNANYYEYSPAKVENVPADTYDLEIVMHGRGALEGTVLRADTGEPVTDFELFLINGSNDRFRSGLLSNGQHVRHPEGHFSRKIYVGWVTVTAKAPGFTPAFQSVEVREHETTAGIELRLEPASLLSGTVVDSDGEPVPDARVFLGQLPNAPYREQFAALTDSHGSFTIDSPPAGIGRLSAFHPDYAPAVTNLTDHTRIVLRDAGTVEGFVIYAGEPYGAASISVRYIDRRQMPWTGSESSGNGAYRVGGLEAGAVQVSTTIIGDRTLTREAIIEAGATTEVDLDFPRATSSIYGQVHAAEHDPQRIDVQYILASDTGVETRLVHAESSGAYIIDNVPAGLIRLSAQISSPGVPSLKRFVDFELMENETLQQDFYFSANGTISGHFQGFTRDLYGAVIVLNGKVALPDDLGSEFFMNMEKRYAELVVSQAECDETGAFVVDGLAAGTYTVLALTVPSADDDNLEMVRATASVVEIVDERPVELTFDFR